MCGGCCYCARASDSLLLVQCDLFLTTISHPTVSLPRIEPYNLTAVELGIGSGSSLTVTCSTRPLICSCPPRGLSPVQEKVQPWPTQTRLSLLKPQKTAERLFCDFAILQPIPVRHNPWPRTAVNEDSKQQSRSAVCCAALEACDKSPRAKHPSEHIIPNKKSFYSV